MREKGIQTRERVLAGAKAFGFVFRLDDMMMEQCRDFGIDREGASKE